ncbi:hypothetical protein HDK77DRAFT_149832 [Phyllosticta capitalensis]|uniref:uncharacterized protein n=1 Tax=Phyllosticta capitalensis TaxID=121624 RepID=UPI00312EAB43
MESCFSLLSSLLMGAFFSVLLVRPLEVLGAACVCIRVCGAIIPQRFDFDLDLLVAQEVMMHGGRLFAAPRRELSGGWKMRGTHLQPQIRGQRLCACCSSFTDVIFTCHGHLTSLDIPHQLCFWLNVSL